MLLVFIIYETKIITKYLSFRSFFPFYTYDLYSYISPIFTILLLQTVVYFPNNIPT